MALNHMGFVNLLGYMAVKTPLLDCDKILSRYVYCIPDIILGTWKLSTLYMRVW